MKDQNNFHENTYAMFARVQVPDREPDFVSESGSQYYFTNEGVYRFSDHWGSVASCCWEINESFKDWELERDLWYWQCGFAKWSDFKDRIFIDIDDFDKEAISFIWEGSIKGAGNLVTTGLIVEICEFGYRFMAELLIGKCYDKVYFVFDNHPKHWAYDFKTIDNSVYSQIKSMITQKAIEIKNQGAAGVLNK